MIDAMMATLGPLEVVVAAVEREDEEAEGAMDNEGDNDWKSEDVGVIVALVAVDKPVVVVEPSAGSVSVELYLMGKEKHPSSISTPRPTERD